MLRAQRPAPRAWFYGKRTRDRLRATRTFWCIKANVKDFVGVAEEVERSRNSVGFDKQTILITLMKWYAQSVSRQDAYPSTRPLIPHTTLLFTNPCRDANLLAWTNCSMSISIEANEMHQSNIKAKVGCAIIVVEVQIRYRLLVFAHSKRIQWTSRNKKLNKSTIGSTFTQSHKKIRQGGEHVYPSSFSHISPCAQHHVQFPPRMPKCAR